MPPSLYIHIPFCKQKCPYCDFYSITCYGGLASDYIEALLGQLKEIDAEISSIYIGGGTPTVLGYVLWDKLLTALKRFIKNGIEFTVEANPESLKLDILKLFLDSGVNRLSIGVQSLRDEKLKALGRIHTAKSARNALLSAACAGFKNIGMDLIFGTEDEDFDDWKEELKEAAGLGVRHISCYALSYEKDTPLFKALEKKLITALENEVIARMYEWTVDYLESMGFKHYEVSNFAQEGYRCRHNLNYWENNSYIGLGPSAVSCINGERKGNIPDVKEYLMRLKRDEDLSIFREKLSPIAKARETSALKIRTAEGISLRWFKEKSGFDFLKLQKESFERLCDDGLIDFDKNNEQITRIYLTRKGFLHCDAASSAFV